MNLPLVIGATAPDIAMFVSGAILVIGGALGVIAMRKPVHSALCLVVTLVGVAVLFVAQQANFLAAVQVIVYAGAIVVLFLFVIMLLGVDRVERATREPLRAQRPLAVVVALAIVGLTIAVAQVSWQATGLAQQGGPQSDPGTDIEHLADSIFTQYLFPFEATSILLVIAVVGAVVLSRRSTEVPPDEFEDGDEDDVVDEPDTQSKAEVAE